MKLRNIILSLIAIAAVTVSCQQEIDHYLDNFRVSSSYASLSTTADVNSCTIAVDATEAWTVQSLDPKNEGAWLTVSPMSGSAGQSQLTFSAGKTLDGRSAEVRITCGGQTQIINVIQGLSVVAEATCAEVIAGPDSKTYRVKGICTSIANTVYGNWYLDDGTGVVYIYGTLNNGKTQQFSSLNPAIEVGDEILVEGPKTTYNGTVELVDVTVVQVNKSLIKVEDMVVGKDTTNVVPIEGANIKMDLMCKGNGVKLEIPADAQSWLSVTGIITGNNKAVVNMIAQPNPGGDRETLLTFVTTDGKKDYTAQYTVKQTGAIIAATIDEFNKAEVGTTQYRISGVVTGWNNKSKGRFYIKDYTGDTYVYGSKEFANVEEGDVVTVIGTRGVYGTTIEMMNPEVEKVIKVKDITLAEFKNLPDDKSKGQDGPLYRLTGTVGKATDAGTKFDLDNYGNFGLIDAAGTNLYIYGVHTGWGAPKTGNPKFGTLGVKEGDEITMIAYKTSYNGLVEGIGWYISHKAVSAVSYKKVNAITSGKQYLMVADGKVAGLLAGKTYGYLSATAVTIENDVIAGDYAANEVTITVADGGNYTMAMEGMYLYQSGTYNSFNWVAAPTEGQFWSFSAQANGAFKVTNVAVSKWIQLDSSYGTWGSYNEEKGSYPTFYEKQ